MRRAHRSRRVTLSQDYTERLEPAATEPSAHRQADRGPAGAGAGPVTVGGELARRLTGVLMAHLIAVVGGAGHAQIDVLHEAGGDVADFHEGAGGGTGARGALNPGPAFRAAGGPIGGEAPESGVGGGRPEHRRHSDASDRDEPSVHSSSYSQAVVRPRIGPRAADSASSTAHPSGGRSTSSSHPSPSARRHRHSTA